MYPFDQKETTTKKSKWTNQIYGIVIHHTAGGSFSSNMRYLSKSIAKSSVHFVIWPLWEVWKIWEPTDILWHAWNGSRWGMDNVNNGFLWIEVVGHGEFNIHQLMRLTDLVEYLMWNFPSIDEDNIVRHSDVTQDREITRQKILRDWKRKVKKIDIGLDFFWDNEHFKTWREQLIPRQESRYWNI